MAWQLVQQAISKVAYPAIHSILVQSITTYLQLVHKQIDRHELSHIVELFHEDSSSRTEMNIADDSILHDVTGLESIISSKPAQINNLHQHIRFYMAYLEACHQLYIGLQKRKSQIVHLLDEIERLMKKLLEVLSPLCRHYEQWTAYIVRLEQESMKIASSQVDTGGNDPISIGATQIYAQSESDIMGQEADASATSLSTSASITTSTGIVIPLPTDTEASISLASTNPTATELSVPVTSIDNSPRHSIIPPPLATTRQASGVITVSSSNNTPRFVFATLPKVVYEEHWDSKELVSFVSSLFTSVTTTTTAGNKRSRSTQLQTQAGSNATEGAYDGSSAPPPKQARRSSSSSASNNNIAGSSAISSHDLNQVNTDGEINLNHLDPKRQDEVMDEEVML